MNKIAPIDSPNTLLSVWRAVFFKLSPSFFCGVFSHFF